MTRSLWWRFFEIFYSYIACVAVTAAVACLVVSAGKISDGAPLFPLLFIGAAAQALPYFLICVALAELARIRSLFYYLAFSLAPAVIFLMPAVLRHGPVNLPSNPLSGRFVAAFLIGSLAGGLIYWRLAGRTAGAGRREVRPAAEGPPPSS